MEKIFINEKFKHFLHGGDYNPDQWQSFPEVLEEDMRLMKLANCNNMSVGIFAWATLEPEEGKYDFSYMDKALDDIYANGGRVFLATPSAARPAWLAKKYPEVLLTNREGDRIRFGSRHNHCYTSPIYREKVANINRRLAERYGNHPAVIGWHISNEYGGNEHKCMCCCELCKAEFRRWLREKYGTLDTLNEQWWSYFWSHTYTDWENIDPPMANGESSTHGLIIDWRRFITHQMTDFMKNEIRAVKSVNPDIPVTTNLMSFFPLLDYREMVKELDFVSNDMYPAWSGRPSDVTVAVESAAMHDLIRSFKHKPFVLMESTPSLVNWHIYNKLKRPGQHEVASLQAVAHGSDSVMYFQWRKSRGSSEKFHGAVVDHVGHENTRVFREVSALGKRLAQLDEIVGTQTVSRVAILYDWSNRWALDDAQGFQRLDKKLLPTLYKHYASLWKKGVNTDIIGIEDDFSAYDLIIAPMMYVTGDALVEKMESYVKNGGTLLATYMLGMVNENDLVHLGGFPAGVLKDVFGIWNEEIDTLYPEEKNVVEWNGKDYSAVDYCELIHTTTAKTLATYKTDFYAGMPAITKNIYGKGAAYYIAFRDTGDASDLLTEQLLDACGITSDFDGPLPAGVSAHSRTDGETVFLFLQNFNAEEAKTATAREWQTVEDGRIVTGEITLAPYETLILSGKI